MHSLLVVKGCAYFSFMELVTKKFEMFGKKYSFVWPGHAEGHYNLKG